MKKRKFQAILIIISLCIPSFVYAQNLEEIIAEHIDAHGGIEKWNKIETIKTTAKITAFSIDKDFMSYRTKDGCYYSDFHLGEKKQKEAYNGKDGWIFDPWMEIFYARKTNSGENNMLAQKAEFFTPFYNYKEKGHSVELIGRDKVDGIDVFVLKLTRKNGKTETWHLNSETYLEYKCESDWIDFTQTLPAEIYFDDFRTVDGLVIPFFNERIFRTRHRIIQIENVEFNADFDRSLLVMPRREEIKKLGFMEGKWDVTVEMWGRRGSWENSGETTSAIHFASTNMLQENICYESTFPITKITDYTYNDLTKKYRISVFDDLTSTIKVLEGEFKDTTLVFDDTKISFGDVEEGNECTQYLFTDIQDDGFALEIKASTDKGKTWNPRGKFTYVRKE